MCNNTTDTHTLTTADACSWVTSHRGYICKHKYYDIRKHLEVFLHFPVVFPSGNMLGLLKLLKETHDAQTLWLEDGVALSWKVRKDRRIMNPEDYRFSTSELPDGEVGHFTQECDIVIEKFASSVHGKSGQLPSPAQRVMEKFVQQVANQAPRTRTIWLYVTVENIRARRFYERNNFKVVGSKGSKNCKVLLLALVV